MTAEEAYLKIVENWLREWRTIVFPQGAIDDLCERITMTMQEAADEIERLRLYKETNESLLIAAAGEQQAEVERLRGHLKIGDRVEHPDVRLLTAYGTVEAADDRHVMVKWDDGQTGLFYFEERVFPSARRLIRLG